MEAEAQVSQKRSNECEGEKPRRDRGTGCYYKPRFFDKKTKQPHECSFWYIQYYRDGIKYVESTHSKNVTAAKNLLKKRLGQIEAGQFVEPNTRRIQVDELVSDLLREYRINQLKSADLSEKRWEKHLRPFFGGLRTAGVTTDALNRYVERRLQEGAQNGTINRELALLRRAFYVAYRSSPRKVSLVPNFPRLTENPPRTGFVEDAQYNLLCRHADELWLRAMLAMAYTFGFRKAELLNMRLRQVDLFERTIRLEPGSTKNKEGRVVKMTNEVYQLLAECGRGKDPDDYVFTREQGLHIRDFRGAWGRLCCAAGLGQMTCPDCSTSLGSAFRCKDCRKRAAYDGLIFHDLRRSAVRNMVRSGVPERVAMKISGHLTRAVFERYNIVSETDLAEAAKKIEGARLTTKNNQSTTKATSDGREALPKQASLTN